MNDSISQRASLRHSTEHVMRDHWNRFVWNCRHLRDTHTPNPWRLTGGGDLQPKVLVAYQDLGHSAKNLFVEAGRVYLGLGKQKAIDDANKSTKG